MPLYIYKHPETNEHKEILQGMNDVHEYFEDDVKWQRVFTSPNASIDGVAFAAPESLKDFVKVTDNKKLSVGDIQDISKEASAKRAEKNGGVDPIKQKSFDEYSSRRRGIKHQDERKARKGKDYHVDY